ncbi:MAG TPA: MBL fold metallo-hydrolase [Gaiellales bacterium]|nr:MBL fold metallo-hydrolase [Gaiellales bacterium]
MPNPRPTTSVQLIGGPTVLITVGGLRLLTDPTFDPPGQYRSGSGSILTKTAGPAVPREQVGALDAVLLSHDQHPDNLDTSGRELLGRVPIVLGTASAATRLGEAVRPLAPYQQFELTDDLTVTAVPAEHGPAEVLHLSGEVIGFVLSRAGLPRIYVSGDNSSVEVARQIGERLGPFDLAILYCGAANTPVFGDALITMNGVGAAEAAVALAADLVVPAHVDGWAHFTEGRDQVERAFLAAGLGDRLRLLAPGERLEL